MKEFKLNKTQYLRLQGYLYDVHTSGKACVFASLTGHVNWFEVSVATSKNSYNEELYSRRVHVLTDYKPSGTDKELVDEIIAGIEEVISNKQAKIEEIKKEREMAERAKYDELKAKYGA